jgi:hypothetical protein
MPLTPMMRKEALRDKNFRSVEAISNLDERGFLNQVSRKER